MIGGNTTNLNDFNNMKYTWVSGWYRQAMNNFWIPEEINLGVDIKDYRNLPKAEKRAYDKILSFLIFLIVSRRQIFRGSASISRQMRSIYVCLFRHFRRRCTAKVTATCWIPSASRRSETRFCISGRKMNICLREMNLSEIFIMHFRQKRAWKCW